MRKALIATHAFPGPIDEIVVRSDRGDVAARGIDVHEARVQSDSRDVRLELVGRQRLVRAHADAGDVDVVTRDVRAVDARTSSGDVRVVVPRGEYATATQTESGDVSVDGISRNERAAASIEARADSGDVTLHGR